MYNFKRLKLIFLFFIALCGCSSYPLNMSKEEFFNLTPERQFEARQKESIIKLEKHKLNKENENKLSEQRKAEEERIKATEEKNKIEAERQLTEAKIRLLESEREGIKLSNLYRDYPCILVSIHGGTIQFDNITKQYISPPFSLAENEVKKIRFFPFTGIDNSSYIKQTRQTRLMNHNFNKSETVWVAYKDKTFYFDVLPDTNFENKKSYVSDDRIESKFKTDLSVQFVETQNWRAGNEYRVLFHSGRIEAINIEIFIQKLR